MLNVAPRCVALADARGHLLEIVRDLGNQDHVGAAGDPAWSAIQPV